MEETMKRIAVDTFREVLAAADVAFETTQGLNPSEALKYGVALVESRMQDSHLITEPYNFVGPGEEDPERWYRMQSNGQWYGVLDCCRPCATKLLQGWTSTGHREGSEPDWLVKL